MRRCFVWIIDHYSATTLLYPLISLDLQTRWSPWSLWKVGQCRWRLAQNWAVCWDQWEDREGLCGYSGLAVYLGVTGKTWGRWCCVYDQIPWREWAPKVQGPSRCTRHQGHFRVWISVVKRTFSLMLGGKILGVIGIKNIDHHYKYPMDPSGCSECT